MIHRRFVLNRLTDDSGVSGTGIVAEGILFTNGVVALEWTSAFPTSVVFHHRGMESVEAVHGHGGHTQIVWLDDDDEDPVYQLFDEVDRYTSPGSKGPE